MEKIKFNYKNSPEYKQGLKDFHEGNLKNEGKKLYWIKAKVSKKGDIGDKGWTNHYSKISGYTFLGEDGDNVWVGYCGAVIPDGALEITNTDELLKIQRHREAAQWHPQPMEKIK